MDDACDEHDEGEDNEDVDADEGIVGDWVPAGVWVLGAENTLGKEDVDDEEKDNSCSGENLGSDGDADVGRVAGPDDTHDDCRDACHAEAEHHAGENEFVGAFAVGDKDGHMRDRAEYEKRHEDGADGHVNADGGDTAQACCRGDIGRTLGGHGLRVECTDQLAVLSAGALWSFGHAVVVRMGAYIIRT